MTIPQTTRTLDRYDAALLTGGCPRLVDTALVALVESGHVRVEPSGEFRAVLPSRQPVEAAVLDAVGTRGHRSVDTIRRQLLHTRRLDQEFRRLYAEGLVRRAIPSRLARRTHPRTTAAGRRALQRFAERSPADGGNAALVALHGRDAMPDRRLRDEIFEHRPVVLPPRRERQPSRTVDPSHLSGAPYQKGGTSLSATDRTFFDRLMGSGG